MDKHECSKDYAKVLGIVAANLGKLPIADLDLLRIYKAWERGGLLEFQRAPSGEIERHWLNVVAHLTAVAVVGYAFAEALDGHTNEELAVGDITTACLVHDAFKRREYQIVEEAKFAGEDTAEVNRGAEIKSGAFLLDLGFSERVVELAKTTGDLGLDLIMAGGTTLAQQIVFYADRCVTNYTIVDYKKRSADELPHFQPGGRYEMLEKKFLERLGKTHHEAYDEVVLPLERKLAELLGLRGDASERLAEFVTNIPGRLA